MLSKKLKGQYFTTNLSLQNVVCDFVKNDPTIILEPSVGRGDLISAYLKSKNNNTTFHMYEIDETIELLPEAKAHSLVYGDFLTQDVSQTYNTIIGNPPFVKQKGKSTNLYVQFIEKCFKLLNDNGELVFIVPADFLKLTSAKYLLKQMVSVGTFTHIHYPNDEKLFADASIDVMVFRYCKTTIRGNETIVNGEKLQLHENDGMITFSNITDTPGIRIGEYFDCFVGMVSGKESVYKNPHGNIQVLNQKDKIDRYIFTEKFPTENAEINGILLSNKDTLINRKIRKFNNKNWFEWGAPRNKKTTEKHMGKKAIYVATMTRKPSVAFLDKVQYFGGSLLVLIPKAEHPDTFCEKVVGALNSDTFKKNFTYAGRFKIGQRQLINSNIYPI